MSAAAHDLRPRPSRPAARTSGRADLRAFARWRVVRSNAAPIRRQRAGSPDRQRRTGDARGRLRSALAQGHFRLGVVSGTAPVLVFLLSLCFQSCQRCLNPERLQMVQNFLCNGAIDSHAPKGNTARDSHSIERAAANVTLRRTTFAAVGDIELAPAARAAKEAWQQGLAAS